MEQSKLETDSVSYIPSFDNQELLSTPISNNPLIIIHPGFKYYNDDENDQKYMAKFKGYKEYIGRLRERLREAENEGRTVIVYSPKEHLNDTLGIVGPLKTMVLIPNEGDNIGIDSESLGVSNEEFYEMLSKKIKEAELGGEFNDACVSHFENTAGFYIDLTRNHNIIFPSDEQLGIRMCRPFIKNLLTIPDKDFLVFNQYGERFSEELHKAQGRLRKKLEGEHKIREGGCLSVLVGYLTKHSGIDDDHDNFLLSQFYDIEGIGKWSKSVIRRNIKKLENLDLLAVRDFNENEKKIYKKLDKMAKENKIKFNLPRKMVESKITVKSSDIDCDEEEIGKFDIKYIIRDVSAQELEEAKKVGLKFDKVIDIRGMDESERTKAISDLYMEFKRRNFKAIRVQDFREKRMGLINETKEKLNDLPHIKQRYLIGSYADRKENESSDIDVLLVRDSCPGMRECFYRFRKGPLDVFCFTEDEMEELKRRRALITTNLKIF